MKRMWSKNELNRIIALLLASGQLNNVKVFDNIVDKDGHKRFIEGDIEIEEITGVTQTYGKWSLSGTHLMIVVACNVAAGTLAGAIKLCDVNLPDWIKDKIVVTFPVYYTAVIGSMSIKDADSGDEIAPKTMYLRKDNSNNVYISFGSGSVSLSNDALFRLQFDLLIDND